ncbi:MAG: S41 family peptidase [Alphaproteobacteria bacterium]|nr:S41 family peptidase [Alphaproteobacteria bacterium]
MRKRIIALAAFAVAAPALFSPAVLAQPAPPAAPAALSEQARQEVVAKLSGALRERYVFPDVGEKAAARITAALAAGDYSALGDPASFAARLQADVDAVAHDKHLRINAMNGPPPGPPPGGQAMPPAEAGIVRADRLPGGVGYIEVVGFPPPEAFRPAIDRAMSALAGSKALIVDIRRNGGGAPPSVAYLVSFLLPPGQAVPINDIVSRVAGTANFTRESFRRVPTPVSFAGVPVYVLTSSRTFSGGEEFAYDVKSLKRGVLVGEVTGGGANPTGPVPLGNGFMASIPFGRAENPVTKTNWEGRGVEPDVKAPAAEALKLALERLGQKPAVTVAEASGQQVFAPRSTPLPGTEAALRAIVAGLASGKPDYQAMSPELAERTREQLPDLQRLLQPLGELRSAAFAAPLGGGDAYDLVFANGTLRMGVILGPDGKIVGSMIAPGRPPAR